MSDNKTAAALACGPCCGCITVSFDPIKHEDGGCSERWRCVSCGAVFIRDRPAVPRLPMSREELERVAREFGAIYWRHNLPTDPQVLGLAKELFEHFAPFLDGEPEQETKRFYVSVLGETASDNPRKYTVECSTENDAMLIAFALDGGWTRGEASEEDASGMLELAKEYCKVDHSIDPAFASQPAPQTFGEEIVDAMEGFTEEVEGPEVDLQEAIAVWDASPPTENWINLPISDRRSALEYAKFFQNRGFQMGRAAAQDLADSRLRQRWDDNDEYRSQIESLTAELRAVTEERDRLREENQELQEDLSATRNACGQLCRGIKKSLGMDNYPEYDGVFIDGLLGSFESELARLKSQPAQPVTAIAGPPDLEGVPDNHWFIADIYEKLDSDSVSLNTAKRIRESSWKDRLKWHIPLGPITPPADPPKEGPVCPVCGNCLQKYYQPGSVTLWCRLGGDRTHNFSITRKTEAEAIEAARLAGKGE